MFRYAALHHELKTVVQGIRARGERVIVDYARENVNSLNDVAFVRRTNEIMIDNLPIGSMCALKMTSFGSRTSLPHAVEHVDSLIDRAKSRGILTCIDAEDVLYPDACYRLAREHNNKTMVNVYITYQMYRRRAFSELVQDLESAKYDGFKLGVKLVRGAYLRKQTGVFGTKRQVDQAYDDALTFALPVPHAHTMLATHNAESLRLAREFPKNTYYTAQLLGMGVGGDGATAQIDYRYVPYGSLWELSPYLLRRLWERMAWT